MKFIVASMVVLLAAGCASGFDGRGLVPGQATAEEVEKSMGPSAEKRAGANGETVLWFPRQPAGHVSFAARIGRDGKLIAIEQRLTRENFEEIKRGETRQSQVRDLLGPPSRIDQYPRREREVWTYHAVDLLPQIIVVQFSADGVVREAYMIDDPEYISRGAST